jgi:hypothetical protein
MQRKHNGILIRQRSLERPGCANSRKLLLVWSTYLCGAPRSASLLVVGIFAALLLRMCFNCRGQSDISSDHRMGVIHLLVQALLVACTPCERGSTTAVDSGQWLIGKRALHNDVGTAVAHQMLIVAVASSVLALTLLSSCLPSLLLCCY